MDFSVPDLPYSYEALEPYIDAETMHLHHDKHHVAYASNLANALKGTEYQTWSMEKLMVAIPQLPEGLRDVVRNNGGGHYNHSLFWTVLEAPFQGSQEMKPSGILAGAIEEQLGGFESFRERFSAAALKRFGSGWAWLVVKKNNTLAVTSTANQDNPITDGDIPILGLDVWEHAYYLKYRNRRAEYVENFFKIISWDEVTRRYQAALARK